MEIYSNSAKYLEILLNVVFVVLPTLAALAATHPLGKRAIAGFIDGYRWIKDRMGKDIVKALAEQSGKTPEEVSAILYGNLDKVKAILENAGG